MRGVILGVLIGSVAAMAADHSAADRLSEAASVFNEIMATPDKGIPQDLLSDAHCVVIVPGLKKGAFVVGGEYGRGFVTCRAADHRGWSAPAAIRVEGGSVGFQIGGSSTDLVMLVMNAKGADKLLGDKFTVGADASVAAGPVGRTANASTDAKVTAEILAWSRAKGLFAGISLNGATLRPDKDENRELYGSAMTTREIVNSAKMPAAGQPLITALGKYSMREGSNADRSKQ